LVILALFAVPACEPTEKRPVYNQDGEYLYTIEVNPRTGMSPSPQPNGGQVAGVIVKGVFAVVGGAASVTLIRKTQEVKNIGQG
jgi:hypothetical protein